MDRSVDAPSSLRLGSDNLSSISNTISRSWLGCQLVRPSVAKKSLSSKGSRLAHVYGLPKTHKPTLSMRQILSASGTYNYKLAKWLEGEAQAPLIESIHQYILILVLILESRALS